LIKYFLNATCQSVLFDNIIPHDVSYSNWEEVKSGVPQGLILSLLLFLLYINDLPKRATKDANIVLFADDTYIIVANSSDTNLKLVMKEVILDINKWYKTNLS
jgi:hypothetical protein